MDCSPSAPSIRFSALSHPLFVGRASVCACMVSHPHYHSRFSYCNHLYALICFHIRTIPPTFRRGASLLLPLHRTSLSPQPLQKNNNPSLSTTSLPPLEKGWGSVARSSRANYGGDCSPSAPSMRFSTLSLEKHQHPCLACPRCIEYCYLRIYHSYSIY